MDVDADFSLADKDGEPVARLTGDWTAHCLGNAGPRLAAAIRDTRHTAVDMSGVKRCDTAGAYAVLRAVEGVNEPRQLQARPETHRLLELVAEGIQREPTPVVKQRGFYNLMDRLGRGIFHIAGELYEIFDFLGHLLVAIWHSILNPRRIRWAPTFNLAERAGLDALPIVAITTFFIGAVVGLLGVNTLRQFGAEVLVVETIGIAVLREFGIVITAVLLAGRSASSFAAEIGSMKMNQEIDAMQVMGVDPFDALVVPRFVALLITLPLLVFVADLSGLFGGMIVSWSVLDLSPTFFMQRIVDNVGVTPFWLGLYKAPVVALVVAGIGCRQGLDVGDDVESLGLKVTSAVVQAIFAIILIDAAFALVYMKAGL
ncbi:MAG: MlaE family lipid transporter permease subunit [Caulobacter sp.]|nr:MlaE family lipid transporter permease subunit [Caulobacter sp.]